MRSLDGSRVRRGLLLTTGMSLLAAALVALPMPPGGGPKAVAAVPPAPSGSAVVAMYVGDLRTGTNTVGPLPGSRFGLFASNPTASITVDDGYAQGTPLYTCTADGDGDCVFTVPIGSATGQVPTGTRLWAAPIDDDPIDGNPHDYYANPYWQTGPLSPSGFDPLQTLRHTFQTPPLVAGQTYRSGRDWVTDPGLQTQPANGAPNYTRRIASGGVWPLSRFNAPLADQCGLNVALIADLSDSVRLNGDLPDVRIAMDGIVDALRGTPSQAALFTFGTDSPASGFGIPNTGLRSVATRADGTAFKNLYGPALAAGATQPAKGNYTNWDRGLGAVAATNDASLLSSSHIDLAIFLTDGNPTVYGPISGSAVPPNSGYTRFRELGNAVASANLLKSQNTRILAFGVGAVGTDPDAGYNLRELSGHVPFDGSNFAEADFFQADDYTTVAENLRDVVLAGCAPTISVVKRILPNGFPATGATEAQLDEAAYHPTEGWQFTASSAGDGAITSTNPITTDIVTGAVSFDLETDADGEPFTITETAQGGYANLPAYTSCTNKADGSDTPVSITAGVDSLEVDAGLQDIISCVFYNTAPPQAEPASVIVHKRWRIVTDAGVREYENGAQPSELEARLALSNPQLPSFVGWPWNIERTGYDANSDVLEIRERVAIGDQAPGCTFEGATIQKIPATQTDWMNGLGPGDDLLDLGTPTATLIEKHTEPSQTPLDPGLNRFVITNDIQCRSFLTLVKTLAGDTPPGVTDQNWVLEAISDNPSNLPIPIGVPGPSNPGGRFSGREGSTAPDPAFPAVGTTGVTNREVSGDAIYQLREIGDTTPHEVVHFVQSDLRTRPLEYPLSSGSWACSVADATGQSTGVPYGALGTEGAVRIGLGDRVVCEAVNSTAYLTVIKNVVGGTAQPSDFTFQAQVVDTPPPGGADAHDIAGASGAGTTINVRPNFRYKLVETGNRPGYTLTDLVCTNGETDFDPDDFSVWPESTLVCEATNTFGSWTAIKDSSPGSGSEVEPGDVITYTVTAIQTEGAPTADAQVTDDLGEVLRYADLVGGSIEPQVGTARREGNKLIWDIPSVAGQVKLTYQVRVKRNAWDVEFANVITRTRGGGVDCQSVAPASVTPRAVGDADCDTTIHHTPPGDADVSPGDLGGTGGPSVWWLYAAIGLLAGGVVLVAAATRRRQAAAS